MNMQELLKNYETPCLLLSLEELERNYNLLLNSLPGVEHYYAVKANSHQPILKKLNEIGCSFDVSTNKECKLVKDLETR